MSCQIKETATLFFDSYFSMVDLVGLEDMMGSGNKETVGENLKKGLEKKKKEKDFAQPDGLTN